jgi:Ca2+-binding RTX toxin-like protein
VTVLVNALAAGTFSPTGRLVGYGLGGDDVIQVSGGVGLPAWLYGGEGNDRLTGGGGASVLLGGPANDQLTGGAGRSLLVGGRGADTLTGGGPDDLLLAGPTAFDANEASLAAVLAEWTSGRDYATRVANLRGTGTGPRDNGATVLTAGGPAATVFDDAAADVLQGASGADWFYANRSGGVALDAVSGPSGGEVVDELSVPAP